MSSLDKNIFGKKKLSDIFQEIYNNQKKKEEQISALINELKPLINDIGDATLVVPLIKEYMDLSIKNDEALIKMATIVQRALASESSDDGNFGMTEEEKRQLAEQNAARAKARVRGGSRMLLSDTRLTPETGIQTLGSNEMKVS